MSMVVGVLLPSDWRRWCKKAGVTNIDTGAGQHFPDSLLAVQAAIAGQGVAIVSLVLVSHALDAGVLVAPFPITLPGDGYHFVAQEAWKNEPTSPAWANGSLAR